MDHIDILNQISDNVQKDNEDEYKKAEKLV